jgi:PmbA protein
MTAYLEPEAVAGLLMVFLYMLSGKSVMEGKSRLADKLGSRVVSELITLTDDPLREDGLDSRPFDSEGTPSETLTIIENGVLKSFMHNSVTAQATGQPNTGHAQRSYRGTLEVGPSNLVLEPGAGVAMREGVLVTGLMGLHAGADPISGDFSLQAFGLKIEGGEVTHPVEDFAISGNLLELLGRVVGVGSDLKWTPYGGATPMLEVEDVSFAGA